MSGPRLSNRRPGRGQRTRSCPGCSKSKNSKYHRYEGSAPSLVAVVNDGLIPFGEHNAPVVLDGLAG